MPAVAKANPKSVDGAVADQLSDVLGRFKAWTAAHGNAEKTAYPGARELSYEEALGRFHARHLELRNSRALQDEESANEAAPEVEAAAEVKMSAIETEPAAARRATSAMTRRPSQRRNPGPSREKTAPFDVSAEEAPVFSSRSRPVRKSKPKPSRPVRATHKTPDFQQVLDGALSTSSHAAVNPDESVWLTLRVTAAEQALIQARAAEASLSVSAYLRQCAFEVETLRRQVQRALLEMQTAGRSLGSAVSQDSAPVPTRPPAGVFTGLVQRVARLFGGRFTSMA
jgi:hypothetical protein